MRTVTTEELAIRKEFGQAMADVFAYILVGGLMPHHLFRLQRALNVWLDFGVKSGQANG